MKTQITLIALALSACQTTSQACDINYVGPPPANYIEAGREALVITLTLSADEVLARCDDTPVGCVLGYTDLGEFRVWQIAVVDDPSPWSLTPQQVEDHELAHVGGWNRCHNN